MSWQMHDTSAKFHIKFLLNISKFPKLSTLTPFSVLSNIHHANLTPQIGGLLMGHRIEQLLLLTVRRRGGAVG